MRFSDERGGGCAQLNEPSRARTCCPTCTESSTFRACTFRPCYTIYYSLETYLLSFYMFSPSERSWTYKCNGEKCIREHYNADNRFGEKRIPFMSCAMVCGDSNIWPMPTGKTSLSTRSLTLRSADIAVHVETKFSEVERMFRLAFDIFMTDLRDLEGSLGAPVNGAASARGSSERQHDEKSSSKESGQNPDVSESGKHCDIKNLDIRVMIDGSPNVYVSLDMDESYNMTVLSKYIVLLLKCA